jgi:hypothetical protein
VTLLVVTGTVVWTHALAGTLGHFTSAAVALTLVAAAAGTAGALALRTSRAILAAVGVGTTGVACAAVLAPEAVVPALVSVPVAAALSAGGAWLARRLPQSIDGMLAGRPLLAAAWVLMALVAVLQVGRLATYMTDGDSDWFLSTRHPFYAKHECFDAYLYGAELDRRGEPNIYDPAHYPGLDPRAEPRTELAGMTPEDPFQYPPQFLLLPRLALELTHDYQAIRLVWFGINFTLCLGAVLLLALWVGGRVGAAATLLLPFLVASFPVLHDFQYGQFHFAAVALATLGMLAFATRRTMLGGTLLATAILSKLFPAFLLLPLAARRGWRELAATAFAGAGISALAFAVLGPHPFVAFLDFHLPRLGDGQAFAFGEAWPEVASLVTAGNQGIQGMVHKLAALGVPGTGPATAKTASDLFMLALVGVGLAAGRRATAAARPERALTWLGLLGLASLASAGAWADYVPLTAVWTLTLLAPIVAGRPGGPVLKATLGISAVLSFTLLGTVPLGSLASPSWMLPLSFVGGVTLLLTFGGAMALGEPGFSASIVRRGSIGPAVGSGSTRASSA